MDGQLSIFDIFSGDVTGGFCFDQDINHSMLRNYNTR